MFSEIERLIHFNKLKILKLYILNIHFSSFFLIILNICLRANQLLLK